MDDSTQLTTDRTRREMRRRLFWFIAGAGINYLLIATPFKWLHEKQHWPIWLCSICSVGLSTVIFFFWNYFINFRTDARKQDALARYLGAVGVMFLLSSTLLSLLKQHDFGVLRHVPLDLDVIATQFFLAGLKFFLYHKWVFPAPTQDVRRD